jgi:hypothetical protein
MRALKAETHKAGVVLFYDKEEINILKRPEAPVLVFRGSFSQPATLSGSSPTRINSWNYFSPSDFADGSSYLCACFENKESRVVLD